MRGCGCPSKPISHVSALDFLFDGWHARTRSARGAAKRKTDEEKAAPSYSITRPDSFLSPSRTRSRAPKRPFSRTGGETRARDGLSLIGRLIETSLKLTLLGHVSKIVFKTTQHPSFPLLSFSFVSRSTIPVAIGLKTILTSKCSGMRKKWNSV